MLLAASGLMIAGMTSCKKEYTCNCTSSITYTTSDPDFQSLLPTAETSTTSYTSDQKKKDSEDWCKTYESSITASESLGTISISATEETTCTL